LRVLEIFSCRKQKYSDNVIMIIVSFKIENHPKAIRLSLNDLDFALISHCGKMFGKYNLKCKVAQCWVFLASRGGYFRRETG